MGHNPACVQIGGKGGNLERAQRYLLDQGYSRLDLTDNLCFDFRSRTHESVFIVLQSAGQFLPCHGDDKQILQIGNRIIGNLVMILFQCSPDGFRNMFAGSGIRQEQTFKGILRDIIGRLKITVDMIFINQRKTDIPLAALHLHAAVGMIDQLQSPAFQTQLDCPHVAVDCGN